MSEPRENVLDKLDALLKKHSATEPDIPVLTDLVEQPRVDLDAIPLLTEEVIAAALPPASATPVAPDAMPAPEPDMTSTSAIAEFEPSSPPAKPIELDLVHESAHDHPAPTPTDSRSVLARLEAVEAEVQADIEARIAQVQITPCPTPSIEIPQDAHYAPLTPPAAALESKQPVPVRLTEDTAHQIAALFEADVARIIKNNLHQKLSEELSGMLNSALDKALSSMLEQFMVHMEEVVRTSIEDELKKQLAPFKRPAPSNKP